MIVKIDPSPIIYLIKFMDGYPKKNALEDYTKIRSCECYGYTHNNKLIGFIAVSRMLSSTRNRYLTKSISIVDLYVIKNHRSKGIGRQLIMNASAGMRNVSAPYLFGKASYWLSNGFIRVDEKQMTLNGKPLKNIKRKPLVITLNDIEITKKEINDFIGKKTGTTGFTSLILRNRKK